MLNTCVTRKKIYNSESLAEEALISAWTTYNYSSGNGPVGIYLCPDCGAYHLTSKGSMNKKLADHLASGKIQKSKEADRWLDKIKRKNRF